MLDRSTRHLHGIEYGNRSSRTRPADTEYYVAHYRSRFFGGVFIRYRCTRRLAHHTQFGEYCPIVQFYNQTISIVREIVALFLPFIGVTHDRVQVCKDRRLFACRYAQRPDGFIGGSIGWHITRVGTEDVPRTEPQRPCSSKFWIKLADAARGQIARVREHGLARSLALFVQGFKIFFINNNLAADFSGTMQKALEAGRLAQVEWYALYGTYIRRHIFADKTIAASNRTHEVAVFIPKRTGQPIKFYIYEKLRRRLGSQLLHALNPSRNFFPAEYVVQAQHATAVPHLLEARQRLTCYALRRAIRRDELRKLGLQLGQLML